MGLDQKPFGSKCSGVQGPGDEEIAVDSAPLRNPEDRLGLAHPPLYLLHRHHRSIQRHLRYIATPEWTRLHCQRRHG